MARSSRHCRSALVPNLTIEDEVFADAHAIDFESTVSKPLWDYSATFNPARSELSYYSLLRCFRCATAVSRAASLRARKSCSVGTTTV